MERRASSPVHPNPQHKLVIPTVASQASELEDLVFSSLSTAAKRDSTHTALCAQ